MNYVLITKNESFKLGNRYVVIANSGAYYLGVMNSRSESTGRFQYFGTHGIGFLLRTYKVLMVTGNKAMAYGGGILNIGVDYQLKWIN